MNTNYLIPANTKKSQLILGFFKGIDLIIVSVGWVWSFIMLLIIGNKSLTLLILIMLPGFIGSFLVMPVPYYHNVLQLLMNIYYFYTGRRKYYWKGWDKYDRIETNSK